MAGPFIDFTEDGRHRFAKYLGITHWICIIPSFICLISALYIQLIIEDKIAFIENYNGLILPGFLVFTGSFGLFAHILCGKAIYSNRVVDKREKWAKFLWPVIVMTFIIFVLELTGSIMCYVHISDLGESFDKGIRNAMLVYDTDIVKKEELDLLQMTYECCGSKSYSEWFSVSWTDPTMDRNNDVPFSCCNPSIRRPCIHHRIHDNRFHYNYDYRSQLTIHKRGCSTELMEFYENSVLTVIASIILSLSFIQLVSCIACRILQTAISEAMNSDDPDGPSQGYIFAAKDQRKGLDDTEDTEESNELLDTTGDTIEVTGDNPADDTFDDDRYIDMDFSEEPVYENMEQPVDDEEHIYNEGDVEDYLAMKFAQSKEVFEPLPPPLEEDEPIYENEPLLRKVKSDKGSFVTLNITTNSFHKPLLSAPTTSIYRHHFPSPIPRDTRTGYYVIDLDPERGKIRSPDKISPKFEPEIRERKMENDTKTINQRKHLSSPGKSLPWTRPRFETFKVQPQPRIRTYPRSVYYSSPKRSPPLYGSINTSRKRSPDRKSYSPIRAAKVPLMFDGGRSPSKRRSRSSSASPERQTFKSGSSYCCQHGLDDTEVTEESNELLDTTGETIEVTGDTPADDTFDDDRYIDMDFSEEPVYENMEQPVDDEEHIYNEGDVEDYLAMKFAQSKEVFEPPPPPLEEDEPIYENEPLLRKVKSDKGSFVTLNNTTNSFHKPLLSAPTTSIYRHHFPSPIPRDTRSGYYVIDLDPERGKIRSPDKISPKFEPERRETKMEKDTKTVNQRKFFSSPSKSLPWTRPRFETFKVQPQTRMRTYPRSVYYSSPKRSPPLYGSINKSRKRSPDRKRFSPIRAAKVPLMFDGGRSPSKRRSRSSSASPERQTFKSGSSYCCQHGITD